MNAIDYFFEHSKSIDKDFVLGAKEKISFKELYSQSYALANYITKNTDNNEKILLISHNSVFFLIVYFAIIKAGRVCVPLGADIEKDNLEFIISECNASIAFIHPKLKDRFALNNMTIYSTLDNLIQQRIKHSLPLESEYDSDRCAEIIFTSGSTGEPKGVMISHKNLIANTASIIEYLELTSDDIIEVVLPFYYCYGLSLLHTHLRVGGSIVLNNTFIFLGSVLNDLKKYKCTGFAGVPSHFQILLRKSDSFKTTHFPHLRYVTQAGGKLHNIFIHEFMEAHPEIKFYVMYGQTEATARLSYLPPRLLESKLGSLGKGIPCVELKVVDSNGNKVKPGEVGEIIAKGDNIMLGYINDAETTSKSIRNGWLYTGDLATYDEEGFIYITARQKEIIKVGGKRISPKEIEEVIVSIPEVIDCTVFGVENELLGEAVKARVTIDKSKSVLMNAERIKMFCHKHLASHKVPQIIEIQENITISNTGKKIKSNLK